MSSHLTTNFRPIDLHVHVLGNGLAGSRCRVQRVWWQEPFVRMMARSIGVNVSPDDVDLDEAYVRKLSSWLQESSLAAVVLLACDDVHQDDGVARPDLSRIYVPNEYVLDLGRREQRFLPGISIHPTRKNALDLPEAGVGAGAVLLKLLPCVQIVDLGVAQYRPFWKRMAELQ